MAEIKTEGLNIVEAARLMGDGAICKLVDFDIRYRIKDNILEFYRAGKWCKSEVDANLLRSEFELVEEQFNLSDHQFGTSFNITDIKEFLKQINSKITKNSESIESPEEIKKFINNAYGFFDKQKGSPLKIKSLVIVDAKKIKDAIEELAGPRFKE